jgi:carbamoyl-phosphate synthase small subunit
MKQGLLVTADGAVFRGRSVGVGGFTTGKAVFSTAMTGYQEIITDPSYAGQVVVLTAPHVGNYGVAAFDNQSAVVHAQSLITRSMRSIASSWRSEGTLVDYFAHHDVVALTYIDTRRLTRHIRERGSMPVAVGVDIDEFINVMRGCDAETVWRWAHYQAGCHTSWHPVCDHGSRRSRAGQ